MPEGLWIFWVGPVVAGLVVLGGFFVLRNAGLGTPAAIKALEKAMYAHGYVESSSWLERLEKRSGLISRFIKSLDLGRNLNILGMDETPATYLGKTISLGVGIMGAGLAVDALGFIGQGTWYFPPLLMFLIGIVIIVLRVSGVRSRAAKLGKALDREISATLPILSAIMSAHGIPHMTALEMLANTLDKPDLAFVLSNERWRRVIDDLPQAPGQDEIYMAIGKAYNSKMLVRLGQAMGKLQYGANASELMTQMAQLSFKEEITEIQAKVAKGPTYSMIGTAVIVMLIMAIILIPVAATVVF